MGADGPLVPVAAAWPARPGVPAAPAEARPAADGPPAGWDARDHAGYAGWLEPARVDGAPAAEVGGEPRADGADGWPLPPGLGPGENVAGAARAWFGYGELPPRPPFPPPGEAGRPTDGRPTDGRPTDGRPTDGRPTDGRPADAARLPAPVVYTPPPAPRPVPAPPVPAGYQVFDDDRSGGPESAVTGWPRGAPLGSPPSQEAFAAAWWRGMELAGRGVLAPVPATRLGGRRVLVGGFGGGSGRTTVAAGLGIALAARRGGRVAAVDACPDQGGPLADRAGVPGHGVGLRELALANPPVASLAEARRFLGSVRPAGLEVLAGLRDLTGPGLTPAEAAWAVDLLERLFPAVVVDGPPGWTQPVPAVLLARADTVVLTAKAGFTESGCAQDALTALAGTRADLPAGAVVVYVETAAPAGRALRRAAAPELPELAEPVHAELTIPYDPALAGGAPVRWDQLRPRTQAAFEALAAAVDDAPPAAGAALGPARPREVGWEGSRDAPWDRHGTAESLHRAVADGRTAGPGEDATVPRARAAHPPRGATAFGGPPD